MVGAELDAFMRRHLRDVHEFVSVVYPTMEVDSTVVDAFRATRLPRSGVPLDDEVWYVFAAVRRLALARPVAPWGRRRWRHDNAAAVRDGLLESTSSPGLADDGELVAESRRLVEALAALTWQRQTIMRVTMIYPGLEARRLSILLGLSDRVAGSLLAMTTDGYRKAYDRVGNDGGSGEVRR